MKKSVGKSRPVGEADIRRFFPLPAAADNIIPIPANKVDRALYGNPGDADAAPPKTPSFSRIGNTKFGISEHPSQVFSVQIGSDASEDASSSSPIPEAPKINVLWKQTPPMEKLKAYTLSNKVADPLKEMKRMVSENSEKASNDQLGSNTSLSDENIDPAHRPGILETPGGSSPKRLRVNDSPCKFPKRRHWATGIKVRSRSSNSDNSPGSLTDLFEAIQKAAQPSSNSSPSRSRTFAKRHSLSAIQNPTLRKSSLEMELRRTVTLGHIPITSTTQNNMPSTDPFEDSENGDDSICLLALDEFTATQQNLSNASSIPPCHPSSGLPNSTECDMPSDDFSFEKFDGEDELFSLALEGSQLPQVAFKVDGVNGLTGRGINAKEFTRFLVLEVKDITTVVSGYQVQEKVLVVLGEDTMESSTIKLCEDWTQCSVTPSDYFHFIEDPKSSSVGSRSDPILVDNSQNFIIVHPDVLVSATHVADSFQCIRKSYFQDICRATNDVNASIVYGNILHEVFQSCITANDFSRPSLKISLDDSIKKHLEDLWTIGENEESVSETLLDMASNFTEWSHKYFGKSPSGMRTFGQSEDTNVLVTNVLDIEEHIWSPRWGMKGNIDATLEVKIHSKNSRKSQKKVVPFELKTGKFTTSISHRAQSTLYTLMMQDRYGVDVVNSLLFYLKTGEIFNIPRRRDEVRGLIINRNQLAAALKTRSLPGMLKNNHACSRCYSLNTCILYHKAIEGGDEQTAGLDGALFASTVGNLSSIDIAFFKKWESLISAEEGSFQSARKYVWLMSSDERERAGSCLSNLIVSTEGLGNAGEKKSQRFIYSLRKFSDGTQCAQNFLRTQITDGDPIVISSEQGHYALAIGSVITVEADQITVAVDRRLKGPPMQTEGFHFETNQEFLGLNRDQTIRPNLSDLTHRSAPRYRLDKDEYAAGMSLARGNLIHLFTPGGDEKRKRLIVDLEAPKFRNLTDSDAILLSRLTDLNADQKSAISKTLTCEDYALILGMPGTGKSTTIAEVVKQLILLGKSVLLTAYTHSALDNVLLKVKRDGIDFLRLGGFHRVHPQIQEFARTNFNSVEEVKEAFQDKRLVATTCLGIKHPIFQKRHFDYCIVDEASQLTLPTCLGPLRFADKFVLVGDHYQLPPLVKDSKARENGLDQSLFRLLSEAHPEAVVMLGYQYRMNSDIMLLANKLIYGGRLQCGTEELARSTLMISNPGLGLKLAHLANEDCPSSDRCHRAECWIEKSLDPQNSVLFVNTDQVPGPESSSGQKILNVVEAQLVGQLTRALLASGVAENEIGIISQYRSQLKVLTMELTGYKDVEVLTVDKYQGKDKDCILISFVRSNPKKNIGDLLRDWRRLNVALTRAKRKLVMFGSFSTLSGGAFFGDMLKLINGRGWVLHLPKGAHLTHSGAGFYPVNAIQEYEGIKRDVE